MTSQPSVSAAQAGPVAPAWDWPHAVPAALAQTTIDMHCITLLEDADPAFWQAFQDRALRQLVAHAQAVSPWWRGWIGNGAVSLPTLAQLRVLERKDFRAAVESKGALRLPAAHGAVAERQTSGSTGVPLRFFASEMMGRLVTAIYLADNDRHRRNLLLPFAVLLVRVPQHPGVEHAIVPAEPLNGRATGYARHSPGVPVREHAMWLARLNPAYLNTHPSVLDGMLDAFEKEGIAPPTALRQVMPTSETVWPELRERTQRLLGASIRDRYTCEEIGPIALQCPHDESRYHVCVANAIVEVVDEAGQPCAEGEPGSVLVTGLHQWASPTLRYELGDIAAWHPHCTCGAMVPTLSRLLGRKRFLIRLPSGERILLRVQGDDFTAVAPVREYRVTQFTRSDIRAEIVLDRPLAPAEHEGIVAMLRKTVHPAFTYHVEQVPAIAWAPGFKRQDLVCLV